MSVDIGEATELFRDLILTGDAEQLEAARRAGEFDPGGPRKLAKETYFTEVSTGIQSRSFARQLYKHKYYSIMTDSFHLEM